MTRERIRKGTILIEDGKIIALGQNLDIPENAVRIDASGKTITPGFVAISMTGVGTSGGQASGRLSDQLNPFDRNIQLALGVGITTGCLQVPTAGGFGRRRSSNTGFEESDRFPGFDPDEREVANWISEEIKSFGEAIPLCPCCNLPIIPTEPITPTEPSPIVPQVSSVIKMTYKSLDGMVVKEKGFLDLTPGALTGPANQDSWRSQIKKAKDYLREQAAHEQAIKEGRKVNPPRKPVSDDVLLLVKKEIALRIAANRVSELKELLQLSKELDYKLVISGCVESWVIPTELAESGASVVITPRTKRQPRFGEEDSSGSWIETPRVLEGAGVPFAVQNIRYSNEFGRFSGSRSFQFAVGGCVCSSRWSLGSQSVGEYHYRSSHDAWFTRSYWFDRSWQRRRFVDSQRTPLDYRSYVEKAIVNGKMVYDRPVDKILPVYEKN